MSEDIKSIADHYGYEAQSMQLIEEMAELTHALSKYNRFRSGQHVYYETFDPYWSRKSLERLGREDIKQEIVDVEICLAQIKYLLGLSKRDIRDYRWRKIKRQLERIEYEQEDINSEEDYNKEDHNEED